MFCSLYRLELNKEVADSDRISVTESNEVPLCWSWSRSPTGRTLGELNELTRLLSSLSFDFSQHPSWSWNLASNGVFSVKKLSNIIFSRMYPVLYPTHSETLRENLVPKKLEVLVWRVSKKRITVRVELDNRGIDLHSTRCPVCDKNVESVDHFIVSCKFSSDVWSRL
ncbi:uncharacterized protein [Rutidosis leptorrhynchoides]|uniref:uncharacterized protein n=1 Tax=Rutidosis leptorrhynchoides TaxID=125765 RepID=UPI003A9A0B31